MTEPSSGRSSPDEREPSSSDDAVREADGSGASDAAHRNGAGDETPAVEDPVRITGVEKRFGDVEALSGVDLELRPGEFHGIVGPNGSGKTTLFRIVAGLANPSAGRVERPPATVGFSFQQPRFYRSLTVRENLSVFRSLADDPVPEGWVETLLDRLRLDPVAHRRASALSGGFAKKLDLALALLPRPTYVVLDEPLADVDDFSKRRICSFLAEYQDEDRTVVVSTHRIDEFASLLDRLTIVLDGTVLEDGPTPPADEIRAHYVDRIEAEDAQR